MYTYVTLLESTIVKKVLRSDENIMAPRKFKQAVCSKE